MEDHAEVQPSVADEKHIQKFREAIDDFDLSEIKRISHLYSIGIAKFEQDGRNALTALLDEINFKIFSKIEPVIKKSLDESFQKASNSTKIEVNRSIRELIGYEHQGTYATCMLFFLASSSQGLEKRLTDYFEKNLRSEEAQNIVTTMFQVIRSQYQKELSAVESIITYFLEQEIPLNGFSGYGYNPLTVAMREKNIDLVRFLVMKGADLHANGGDEFDKFSPFEKIIGAAEFDQPVAKKIFDIFLKEGNLKVNDMKEADFLRFKKKIMDQIKYYGGRSDPDSQNAYLNLVDLYENVVARKHHKEGSISLFWQSAKKLASFKELPPGVMFPEDIINAIKDAKPFSAPKGA